MKINIGLFIIIFSLLSCNDKEEEGLIEAYTVKVETYYQKKTSETLHVDVNSDIFVYYGFYSLDLLGYDIDEEGVLKKGDKEIKPDKSLRSDINGQCEFVSEKPDEKITIVIRSNYLNTLYSSHSYSNSKSDILIKNIMKEN